MVGLQCAVSHPALVQGVVLIDISLRLLHVKVRLTNSILYCILPTLTFDCLTVCPSVCVAQKQSPLMRPMVSALQTVLRQTPIGELFFKQVHTYIHSYIHSYYHI